MPLLNYRVSHKEMILSKLLWGVEGLRILIIHLWLHGHKSCSFVFHQPVFKKVASTGLNSLRQKGYQILVKNWIFDDPFHKKGWVLVILVPGMIQPSGSGLFFWWNEAVEVVEAVMVIEAAGVSRPGKSLLGTSESSRFLNLALLWWFEKYFWGI